MNNVQNEQLNNKNAVSTEQLEEVILPDVFAIKKLVENMMEYLPAL